MIRTVWANPVVQRDLRVRLRGAKSFWFQAVYLLLLGGLSIVGYYSTVMRPQMNEQLILDPVTAQRSLQGFYYFIFFTLASMVVLVAPALTAVSITTERQQLSLDLLVTTPLSAAELLTGKMISSVAFLFLLLVLSIPASSICVILGGATLVDVFKVYLLLLVDGILLSAIGLAISCAARTSIAAIVWTYIAVGAFLIVTGYASAGMAMGAGSGRSPYESLGIVACLNPFVSVYYGTQSILIGHYQVPIVACEIPIVIVLGRLLVTAATYRMGRYGDRAVPSLRRQILGISAGLATVLGTVVAQTVTFSSSAERGEIYASAFCIVYTIVFIMICLWLPSLFTAVQADDDDPPNTPILGSYSVRDAFRPVHRGALPYFHLWLLVFASFMTLGLYLGGAKLTDVAASTMYSVLYVSALGYLYWCIARRAGASLGSMTGARGLGFALFAVLSWAPPALIGIMQNATNAQFTDSPLAQYWIFNPLSFVSSASLTATSIYHSMLISTLLCYVLGTLIYLPFWSVVPGRVRTRKPRNVQPSSL